MITIYFDGLCEPKNPGGVGTYGYAIYKDEKVIKKGCRVVGAGKGMTNNVAEYSALKRAVEWVVKWIDEQKINDEITVHGDSKLVINQMKGDWRVSSQTSMRFVPEIRNLLTGKKVNFVWIPRDKNNEADMLSRVAYKRHRENPKEIYEIREKDFNANIEENLYTEVF